ncbi:transforming growth factor-beta-induced protein ig-h3-like [Haliotis rufescens]|uniref:transforming growth factor-beta-induced protein ig-h3-like n=1 Tax=Haliotis rufescens TaxID=6454 RepID=UPI00201E9095|nr:transforming growth factor-beta-induced protein ig-h3-like [Haliotis rufescens]
MLFKILCLVAAFHGAFSADSRNIVQYLAANPEYSTLVGLVKDAGLVASLSAPGSLTVLAPTNDAFKALPASTLSALQKDKNQLKTVLLYHVINKALISFLITDGEVETTLANQNVTFSKTGTALKVNNAPISNSDLIVSNGVIHTLDAVLIPSTENILQYIVKHDDMFSDLFAALVVTNLESVLEGGQFTVFAPTDDAFKKISSALPPDAASLASVLKYHVVPGLHPAASLKDGDMLNTLAGKALKVDLSNGVKIGSGKVISADIMAINGIIHVIDTVQVP